MRMESKDILEPQKECWFESNPNKESNLFIMRLWWNWKTRKVEGLFSITGSAGSTPVRRTITEVAKLVNTRQS